MYPISNPPCRTVMNSTCSIFHANGLLSMNLVVQENRGMRRRCFSINVSIVLDYRQILEIRNMNNGRSATARETDPFPSWISSRDLSPRAMMWFRTSGASSRANLGMENIYHISLFILFYSIPLCLFSVDWSVTFAGRIDLEGGNVLYSEGVSTKLWVKFLSAWGRGHLSNHHPPYWSWTRPA